MSIPQLVKAGALAVLLVVIYLLVRTAPFAPAHGIAKRVVPAFPDTSRPLVKDRLT